MDFTTTTASSTFDFFQSALTLREWLLLLIVLAVVYHTVRQMVIARNYPPTPWNLPVVGNLPWITWGIVRSGLPVYEYLRRLRYTYGNVYALNLCGQLVVFVNDYQSMKEAFNNPNLCDRPKMLRFKKESDFKRGEKFAL